MTTAETTAERGRAIVLNMLGFLAEKHEESLLTILYDREGRALDEDPETLWMIGKAEGAAEVAGLDLRKLAEEVQPDPPDSPDVCAACDNGESLDPDEECPDCGSVGTEDEEDGS